MSESKKMIVIELPPHLLVILASTVSREVVFQPDYDLSEELEFIEDDLYDSAVSNLQKLRDSINSEQSTICVKEEDLDDILAALTNLRLLIMDRQLLDLPQSCIEGSSPIPENASDKVVITLGLFKVLGFISGALIDAAEAI